MWYMDAGSNVRQFIAQFYYLLALLTGPGSLPSEARCSHMLQPPSVILLL